MKLGKFVTYLRRFIVPARSSYRPDIDGLRAFSVVAVMLYHAFPLRLPGGFIGVDIFFVISGYLITGILLKEHSQNSFKYLHFIGRRLRRIVPALATVILSFWVVGWFDFIEEEFFSLSKEMIFGSLFSANILYWLQVGYFDAAAEAKPLLHLWSLGVEEQFYLIWPFLLTLAVKRRFNLIKFSVLLIALSFGFGIWLFRDHQASSFYLIPARFWELATGALLASYEFGARNSEILNLNRQRFGTLFSWLGSGLMCLGLFIIDRNSFPGFWPLIPVIGSLLFIAAGSQSIPNRIFSVKPAVWIGLISYPLYLWHWPLLSTAYILRGELLGRSVRFLALALSVLFSIATYRWVESRAKQLSIRTSLSVFSLVLIALATLGGLGIWKKGFPSRVAAKPLHQGDIQHGEFHQYAIKHYFPCAPKALHDNSPSWDGIVRCHQTQPNSNQTVALIGDSHAEALFYGLAASLPFENLVYLIQGAPLWGDELPVKKPSNGSFRAIFDHVVQSPTIKTVILNAFWTGGDFELKEIPEFHIALAKTVQKLVNAGKKVYLANDVPYFTFNPSRCKAERPFSPYEALCAESKTSGWFQKQSLIDPILLEISKNEGAIFLDSAKYFQNETQILMGNNNEFFYRDEDHLNINGSLYLGKQLLASGALSGISPLNINVPIFQSKLLDP